jgi:hypothetical protein
MACNVGRPMLAQKAGENGQRIKIGIFSLKPQEWKRLTKYNEYLMAHRKLWGLVLKSLQQMAVRHPSPPYPKASSRPDIVTREEAENSIASRVELLWYGSPSPEPSLMGGAALRGKP